LAWIAWTAACGQKQPYHTAWHVQLRWAFWQNMTMPAKISFSDKHTPSSFLKSDKDASLLFL